MANPKTEKVKNEVFKLLKQKPYSLYSLCCSISSTTELLIGAIQSMWAKGDIVLEHTQDKDLLVGDGIIVRFNESDVEKSDPLINEQFISSAVVQSRARLCHEVRKGINEILSDGMPLSEEELNRSIPFYGIKPESDPDIIVLPDGRYTLRTVEAGEAELRRREQEAARRSVKIRRQKKFIENLLKENGVIEKDRLFALLEEPLLPEAAQKLVQLSGERYALPDSNAALEDIAVYLAQREPVGSKEFSRMFKPHKKLVNTLRNGKEISPFVVLSDGRFTVEKHPAGQKELHRRDVLFEVQQKLENLIKNSIFFSMNSNFNRHQRKNAAEQAVDRGCTWIKYGGRTLWCSPLEFSPREIARELHDFTGLNFSGEGKPVAPIAYILDNTYKPVKAARKLSIKPGQVINLYRSGFLPGVNVEGSLRIWANNLSSFQQGSSLDKLIRRAEEVALPEAARMLDVPRGMIRRLVREEYLETIERHRDGRKGPEPVFRRGDVEDLLRVVPGLKEKWESARAHKLKKSEKRRPLRNQEEKTSFSREQKPIVLDSFQCEAIDALDKDNSVLVAAPTGTGKTVIAEKIVEKVLSEGRDIIYTSPIKALSNQKFRDFTHRFGRNKVGLITGDISIYERSPLLVMTTEIFRNWCFSNPEWMSNISFVIFDEIHYLDDPHRGTAWEESIIFAPPHIKILGLSATVPNIHELADWMSDVRQYPVVVVEEKERAVPLVIKYAASSGEILNEREAREEIEFFMEENEKGVKKKSVK